MMLSENENSQALSRLLAQALSGQPLDARQRISRLQVDLRQLGRIRDIPISGLAVSSVAFWLPGLRELHLGKLPTLGDALDQLLIFDALSTLPRLEKVVLPGCDRLDRVGALARTLLCLVVAQSRPYSRTELTSTGITQIARLCQLRELETQDHVRGTNIFLQLTNSLPASVQSVRQSGSSGGGKHEQQRRAGCPRAGAAAAGAASWPKSNL